ncbi:MAG: hypothetical protein AAF250_01010 [Pseudomonadota bacterium]
MGRSFTRLLLQVIGIALLFSGVMWALQGAGILMWPADSFMLAKREWALYGAIAAGIGLISLWASTRVKPRG